MKRLIEFYYKQEQDWFFKALLLIFISNLFGWLSTLFYDSSQWEVSDHYHQSMVSGGLRLPILLTIFFSAFLFWRINRMDVSSKTRTPAAFTADSEWKKIVAKYLVSYVEILSLILMEGVSLILLSDYSFQITNTLIFFIILAGIILSCVTYFIFLPQIMKYYTQGATNLLTTVSYGTILFLIFWTNGILRANYTGVYHSFILFNHSFNPLPSLINLLICLSIIWLYLKQNTSSFEVQRYD